MLKVNTAVQFAVKYVLYLYSKRDQDLKTHKTRMVHHHCKVHKVTETAAKDVILTKRKAETPAVTIYLLVCFL